ncbi:MAG: LLM class flavin-dependent oxidoreductase, partial [Dehalococcoidia bacterium]
GVLDLVDWYPESISQRERYQQVIDLAVVAEELGFDTYWVGEHHFSRYISPHPAVLLAAIAAKTSRIRIGTSVVLAAHHNPMRLAEDYAMVDLISGGRLDLVVGRGLFLDGYRGYGIPYGEVRPRVEEAILAMRQIWTEGRVAVAAGEPLLELQPKPVQRPHPPIWVGGGRAPQSVEFAARQGLHLALPQINGPAELFQPAAELYRAKVREYGHDPASLRVSVGAHTWVSGSRPAAEAEWRESYTRYFRMVAAEMPAERYAGTELEEAASRTRYAATLPIEKVLANARIGGPDEVAERIVESWRVLGMDHCWAAFNLGGLETPALRRAMGRFARDVIPAVVKALP